MGSRALLLVKDVKYTSGRSLYAYPPKYTFGQGCILYYPKTSFHPTTNFSKCFIIILTTSAFQETAQQQLASGSSMESLDVPRLAETARISLTPQEVEEFAPKVGQVMQWFGQLQAVDLESLEPSIKEDTEGDNFRADITETFENREVIISAIPNYEEPFIKVPKVLNKE